MRAGQECLGCKLSSPANAACVALQCMAVSLPRPAPLQSCTPELWHAAMDALQRWAEAGSADYDEGFAQLHHAHQLLAADQPQWHLELPPSLRRRADSAVRGGRGGGVREAPTVSSLQARVAEALRAAGVGPLVEEYPVAGGQSVDIALPEERVAVEVDGPFHYTGERGLGSLGGTPRQHSGWRLPPQA